MLQASFTVHLTLLSFASAIGMLSGSVRICSSSRGSSSSGVMSFIRSFISMSNLLSLNVRLLVAVWDLAELDVAGARFGALDVVGRRRDCMQRVRQHLKLQPGIQLFGRHIVE